MNTLQKHYCDLTRFLGEFLGKTYVIEFYDVADLSAPLASSEKSDQEASLVSEVLGSPTLSELDYVCGKQESSAHRHGVFFVRDEKGCIQGALYIIEKQQSAVTVSQVFEQLLNPNEGEGVEMTEQEMNIGLEIEALTRKNVQEIWQKHCQGKEKMSKADKIAFCVELIERGVFRIKGAPEIVSQETGISLASVYRYMGEAAEE